MTNLLLWLSGLTAFAAMCNFPSWLVLLIRWFRTGGEIERLTLRLGMTLGSFGMIMRGWSRASNISQGVDSSTLVFWTPFGAWQANSDVSLIWVIPLLLAEVLYLLTSAISHCRNGHTAIAPRIFLGTALAWSIYLMMRSLR